MIYDRFPLPESHIVRISLQVSTGLWWADAYERNYINIYIREGGGENSLKLCKNEAYADGRKLTDEADEGWRLMTMGATWRIFIGSRDCYPFWPIHLLAWKMMIYDRFPLPESHIVRISLQVSTGQTTSSWEMIRFAEIGDAQRDKVVR